jgi:hypothetical protein
MNYVLLSQAVEKRIHDRLLVAKSRTDGDTSVHRFELFKMVEGDVYSETAVTDVFDMRTDSYQKLYLGVVTSGVFNRILADMKRNGIICVLRGGDQIVLSDMAYHYAKTGASKGGN